jgi:hemerythrin-like domain-containing protein
MTSPITLHPGPGAGFDEPFEMLLACHQRVERMLGLLERLAAHLQQSGADGQALQAARDVMRYFDTAGPAHHEDEERHVFPLLQAAGEAALVQRLQQDHVDMAAAWARLRQDLQAVAGGSATAVDAARDARWRDFAALYRAHIETEEAQAYPKSQPRLDAAAERAMGREMAERRGVPGPA